MRCYLKRRGYIVGVVTLTGLPDRLAIEKARSLFEERTMIDALDGFEVWDLDRMLIQQPPPNSKVEEASND
jgi:hypothetical protein